MTNKYSPFLAKVMEFQSADYRYIRTQAPLADFCKTHKAQFQDENATLEHKYGLTMRTRYRGYSIRDKMDEWGVVFARDEASFSLAYFTGVGLRISPHKPIWKGTDGWHKFGLVLEDIEKFNTSTYAVCPRPFEVLESLRLDDPGDLSFEEWCREFGYNEDSRKDYKLFEHCQEQSRRWRQVFPDIDLRETEEVLACL